jgi:hypothetical protein
MVGRFDSCPPHNFNRKGRRMSATAVKWAADKPGRAHAFMGGANRSLCGQPYPVQPTVDPDVAHCQNCTRLLVHRFTSEAEAAAPDTERWRDVAVRAVLGDSWVYDDLSDMPTWLAEVDRVAAALADAYRQGVQQGAR